MIATETNPNPQPRLTWRNVALAAGAAAALAGAFAAFAHSPNSPGGFALLEARQLYSAGRPPDVSVPPLVIMLLQPLSRLPLAAAQALLAMLLFALGVLGLALSSSLLADPPSRHPRRTFLLAALLLALPLAAAAVAGEITVLPAFLLIATWALVERNDEWFAGAALGLGAALLPALALAALFYAIKRRWRVVLTATAGFVLFALLLPLPAFGWRDGTVQLREHYAQQQQQIQHYFTGPTSDAPAAHRGLRDLVGAASPATNPPAQSPPTATPRVIIRGTLVTLVLFLTLTIACLSVVPWPPPSAAGIRAVQAQAGAVLVALGLLAPAITPATLVFATWGVAWFAEQRLAWPKPLGLRRALYNTLLALWLVCGVAVALNLRLPAAGAVVLAATWAALIAAGYARPRQGEGMIATATPST